MPPPWITRRFFSWCAPLETILGKARFFETRYHHCVPKSSQPPAVPVPISVPVPSRVPVPCGMSLAAGAGNRYSDHPVQKAAGALTLPWNANTVVQLAGKPRGGRPAASELPAGAPGDRDLRRARGPLPGFSAGGRDEHLADRSEEH